MSMSIKVHKTNEDLDGGTYKQIGVGKVSVGLEYYEKHKDYVCITMTVPIKDSFGDFREKHTWVGNKDNIHDVLICLYRRIVGEALFNADEKTILYSTYSMQTFADWENSIMDDREGIADVEETIQQMIRG